LIHSRCLIRRCSFEKEIEDIANEDKIEALEEEKSNLSGEVTDLTKKLTNYEQLYATLECKYKELEEKLENALKPAPPPPPPLPPPPPTTQSKGFLGKIRRKMKGAAPNQAPGVNQEGYNKAMDEMMKRINSGKLEVSNLTRKIRLLFFQCFNFVFIGYIFYFFFEILNFFF
jgi:hypothetical protein